MADINGVERTYANKDEYDWEGGEVMPKEQRKPLEGSTQETYRGSTRLLDRLKEEKELVEWEILKSESDLEVLTQKIRSLQYEM
jgi:flagellar motility protein MotE (MotC chaperone)